MNGGKMIEQRNQGEQRKIIMLENEYIALKPSRFGNDGQWEHRGKKYFNTRQLYDFMSGRNSIHERNYHCVIEPRDRTKLRQELRQEIRRRKENIRNYHESQMAETL